MIVNWYLDDSNFRCEISIVVSQRSRSVGRLSNTPFFPFSSIVSVSNFSIDCWSILPHL
jgi:hypothetical protein